MVISGILLPTGNFPAAPHAPPAEPAAVAAAAPHAAQVSGPVCVCHTKNIVTAARENFF